VATDSDNPFVLEERPYYRETGTEISVCEAAFRRNLPLMLKGPTGCGKTRFVEFMAWRLQRPLITVSCHEDLFASDLTGRFLLKNEETVWVDGPLSKAVRMGAICYLDEIVEARKDTTVVIHPLTDNRRILTIDKKGETVRAHPDFAMVISYNPGYQSVLKDLKQSTRQRFRLPCVRLSRSGDRSRNRRRGERGTGRDGPQAGPAGRQDPQHPRAGSGGGRQHPAADLHGRADAGWH
jgi:nitric oxide reductase NorQ protein